MTPKTPLLDQLAEHDARVTASRLRARALAEAIAEHERSIEQLKGERIGAYSEDDERKAAALGKRTVDAEAKAVELEERRQGAVIAAQRAQRARDLFVAANHGALVAERAPIAHAAVTAIEVATAALAEGVKAWQAEAGVQVGLLRPVAGRDGRDVPDLAVAQLARDLQRATAGGVPSPLPRAAVQPVCASEARRSGRGRRDRVRADQLMAARRRARSFRRAGCRAFRGRATDR